MTKLSVKHQTIRKARLIGPAQKRRANLETGLRLNEGPSRYAKVERANAMRDLDRSWGLAQLVPGMRNSRVHAMQPTKAEREMEERGVLSKKELQFATEDRFKVNGNRLGRGYSMEGVARGLEMDQGMVTELDHGHEIK